MRAQAGFLALFALLGDVRALYDLPEPPLPRDEQFGAVDPFDSIQSDVLKRSTHDANFPLNFGVSNQVLFNGNFAGGKLTVKCADCRTTGEVTASAMLPDLSDIDITHPGDIFDDSMLGLTFNGVGATISLDLTAAASGDFSMPLLKTESPIGIAGPGFQIGVVFSLDLVLKITGKVETKGGFKVAIPDGSSFMIPFDESKPNVANFNGASASLLPITVDLPADVTVALKLKAQAGVMLPDLEVINAKALAGAFIAIPEVILKETASLPAAKACAVPVSAELNINAGVFVDVGADFAGVDLGDFNPRASTTLFAAATSTCLKKPAGATSTSKTKTTAKVKTTKPGSTATTKKPPKSASSGPAKHHSASVTPRPNHTSFRPPASGRPTPKPKPKPGPSFQPPASGQPAPTTLATSVKPPPSQGSPGGSGGGGKSGGGSGGNGGNGGGNGGGNNGGGNGGGNFGPSSFAPVVARTYARRTAYPITLQSLATPITNFAPAVTPALEGVEAVSVVAVRRVLL